MLELLVLAIAPAVIILWFIYKKDRYKPEPIQLVLTVFLLGALVTIPAGEINSVLIQLLFNSDIIGSSIVAPVVEESLKFAVVFFFVYHNPEFDKPMDGILYAAAAGLGFATIENIEYVLDGGISTGIIRAVATVPGHVIFSCIWGFALGTAKFRPESTRRGIVVAGIAGAMLFHGIFNFVQYTVAGRVLILVVIIPIGWWMTMRNIRLAHADPASILSAMKQFSRRGTGTSFGGKTKIETGPVPFPALQGNQNGSVNTNQSHEEIPEVRFCTHCGTRFDSDSRFCDNCGKEL